MNATSKGPIERVNAARASATRLTVYHLPPDLRTLVAVAPNALEEFPDVAVDEIGDAATIAAALDAIAASEPSRTDRPLDARYGLIFCNAEGERVLCAYKSHFATQGQIDDVSVDFENEAFHDWLLARYPLAKSDWGDDEEAEE